MSPEQIMIELSRRDEQIARFGALVTRLQAENEQCVSYGRKLYLDLRQTEQATKQERDEWDKFTSKLEEDLASLQADNDRLAARVAELEQLVDHWSSCPAILARLEAELSQAKHDANTLPTADAIVRCKDAAALRRVIALLRKEGKE